MKILTRSEIIEFSTPPHFDYLVRRELFALTSWSRKVVHSLHTPANKIGFMLQLGYFIYTGRFFLVETFHSKDIQYICRFLQIGFSGDLKEHYPERTEDRHRQQILEQLGFASYGMNPGATKAVEEEIQFLCSRQIKPRMQFYAVVEYLRENRIEVPGYTTIVQLITDGFYQYETALIDQFEQNMTTRDRKLLDDLVKKSRKGNEKVDPYAR